ncbi:MAG TPA: alcohol dehydrogenase catalytic domain-containing protein [Anaerolineales bacterium]|nr:alcohol dehydrogenase catalytic domain-containing protein [Anaerolineales bacterium]
MKAITVEPKKPGTARCEDIPEPDAREGSVLVEAIAVGVCGTDVEIVEGKYGWAPWGKTRLVLGHESLGRVVGPGPSSALKKGAQRTFCQGLQMLSSGMGQTLLANIYGRFTEDFDTADLRPDRALLAPWGSVGKRAEATSLSLF